MFFRAYFVFSYNINFPMNFNPDYDIICFIKNTNFYYVVNSMIVDDIRFTMEYVEEITKNLGDILCKEDYYIDDGGCPHCQPNLPEGYAAIYIFVYGTEDEEFRLLGINKENVKDWMLNNLHRINIYIKANQGKAVTELAEAVLHYRYRPRFEGNI